MISNYHNMNLELKKDMSKKIKIQIKIKIPKLNQVLKEYLKNKEK